MISAFSCVLGSSMGTASGSSVTCIFARSFRIFSIAGSIPVSPASGPSDSGIDMPVVTSSTGRKKMKQKLCRNCKSQNILVFLIIIKYNVFFSIFWTLIPHLRFQWQLGPHPQNFTTKCMNDIDFSLKELWLINLRGPGGVWLSILTFMQSYLII